MGFRGDGSHSMPLDAVEPLGDGADLHFDIGQALVETMQVRQNRLSVHHHMGGARGHHPRLRNYGNT